MLSCCNFLHFPILWTIYELLARNKRSNLNFSTVTNKYPFTCIPWIIVSYFESKKKKAERKTATNMLLFLCVPSYIHFSIAAMHMLSNVLICKNPIFLCIAFNTYFRLDDVSFTRFSLSCAIYWMFLFKFFFFPSFVESSFCPLILFSLAVSSYLPNAQHQSESQ